MIHTPRYQVRTRTGRVVAECDDVESAEWIARQGRAREVWVWHRTKYVHYRSM